MHGRDPAAHPAAAVVVVPPPARLTLAEAVGGRATHMEAGLAAAVLGPVDLGTAGLAAECRVIRDAPGRRSWGTHHGMGFEMRWGAKIGPGGGGSPTSAGGHPPVCAWYWQVAPVHCWGQRHLYWFSPSRHVPPFWQGLLEHSLISAK